MKSGGVTAIAAILITTGLTSMSKAADDVRLTRQFDKDHPAEFKPAFADRASWEHRAEFLRRQAMVALGLWPMPEKTPLNPVVHGRIDRDGYTIEKVYFASMPGHYVSGNLYRPKNRATGAPERRAAVLAPYGHWPGGRLGWKSDESIDKDIAAGAEIDRNAARSPLQANCAMLARMGCIVFMYDMVGYGDSDARAGAPIEHARGFLDADAVLRAQSFMGLQTWNSIRAFDFLLSLPDVDPDRIAITGSSSGGTQTIALDATDCRAAAAFPMVMISMNMQGGCVCENAPLYRVETNNVELACLFAPKPQGAAAANDWTFDFEKRGIPEMKSIWRLFGAEDLVGGKHIDFGHNHNLHSRELQYAFLNKHLKLGWPEPVKEQPFEPVPPAQLRVYDQTHPMPADFLDAPALRKQMTRASDEQLAAMSDPDFAATVRAALAAMVVDELPASSAVELSEGFVGRSGAGERVPYKLLKPGSGDAKAAQKGIVVWADPRGVSGLDDARPLVDAGFAVLAIDLLDFPHPPASAPPRSPNPPYSGYFSGYNRTPIANQVHDLLTALAMARQEVGPNRTVHLIGVGRAGPAALLARVLAGDAVERAAIDLDQFDFDQIKADDDPMILPGALKYGGMSGFISALSNRPTLICNVRQAEGASTEPTKTIRRAAPRPAVTLITHRRTARQLVEWIVDAN